MTRPRTYRRILLNNGWMEKFGVFYIIFAPDVRQKGFIFRAFLTTESTLLITNPSDLGKGSYSIDEFDELMIDIQDYIKK